MIDDENIRFYSNVVVLMAGSFTSESPEVMPVPGGLSHHNIGVEAISPHFLTVLII